MGQGRRLRREGLRPYQDFWAMTDQDSFPTIPRWFGLPPTIYSVVKVQTMIAFSNSLTLKGGRAPNHDIDGVASTSGYHGLPCVRVGGVGPGCLPQHPVEPHRQFASDGHFGHRFAATE